MDQSFKYVSVNLKEIIAAGGRLEASVFKIEARQARDLIVKCGLPHKALTDPSLTSSISYPGRFKRNYVSKHVGLPFILPSQITEIDPRPTKWIYGLRGGELVDLSVMKGDILLTRSGTVGQCSIAGESIAGKVMSDDLIRIVPNEKYRGYLYVFLTSDIGQMLLTTNRYGNVIKHIEPAHLSEIAIPIADEVVVTKINKAIDDSFDLRNESNKLIDRSRCLLTETLRLPDFDDLDMPENHTSCDAVGFSVPSDKIEGRIDASFHHPIIAAIEQCLLLASLPITTISDPQISTGVILPGRFKRIYVEKSFGVPFIGGKEICNLDPRTGKNLSLQGHGERIRKQLLVEENSILITRSGTIGRVNIAPKYWKGWAVSEHIIRIEARTPEIAGYLFSWLTTAYGNALIQRFTYGSVVDEVDNDQIGRILVPLVDESRMKEIGKLVLAANEKRNQAYILEQEAMGYFRSDVLGIA